MKKALSFIGIISMLFSCKTYTVSVDSFRKQMKNATPENLKRVEINNPLHYQKIGYLANGIESIVVIDKKGNRLKIENSPKLEMRITLKNRKRNILYFDTAVIENDTLKGRKSRFLQRFDLEIPMNDIKRIEIQNGGKAFKYKQLYFSSP